MGKSTAPPLRFQVNPDTGSRELWLGTVMKLGEVVSVVGYYIKIFDGRNSHLANQVPYYNEGDAARVLMRDARALVKTLGADNLCNLENLRKQSVQESKKTSTRGKPPTSRGRKRKT